MVKEIDCSSLFMQKQPMQKQVKQLINFKVILIVFIKEKKLKCINSSVSTSPNSSKAMTCGHVL